MSEAERKDDAEWKGEGKSKSAEERKKAVTEEDERALAERLKKLGYLD